MENNEWNSKIKLQNKINIKNILKNIKKTVNCTKYGTLELLNCVVNNCKGISGTFFLSENTLIRKKREAIMLMKKDGNE